MDPGTRPNDSHGVSDPGTMCLDHGSNDYIQQQLMRSGMCIWILDPGTVPDDSHGTRNSVRPAGSR